MEKKKTVLEMMQNDPTFQNELAIIVLIRNDILNANYIFGLKGGQLTKDREYYDSFLIVLKLMMFTNEQIKTTVANFYLNEIQNICAELKSMENDLEEIAMKLYFKLKEMKR